MKKAIIYCILAVLFVNANGQIKVELHAGGSNFLGLSFNTAYDFTLSASGHHKLTPTIGLGTLIPGIREPKSIIHGGLNYRYKRWGIGSEISGFSENAFWGDSDIDSFVEMIVYPNANFTYKTAINLYFMISAGAYFAFDKNYHYEKDKSKMIFAGDVIPGCGISVGYLF